MTRRSLIVGFSVLVSLVLAGGFYAIASRSVEKDPTPVDAQSSSVANREAQKVLSRGVMVLAQQYSQEARVSPPESARQHAYIASAYATALEKNLSQKDALYAAQEILRKFYPAKDIDADINKVASEYVISQKSPQEPANPEATAIIDTLIKRITTDRHDLVWDGVVPSGEGKWGGKDPLTPRAGEWQRWAVSGVIVIPRPPAFGSEEYKKETEAVRIASEQRSAEKTAQIETWVGKDGSRSPDTAWQDTLYDVIKTDLSTDKVEADKTYARIQKLLAITLADSIMECWRVKYTYWAARPTMIDEAIKTATPDPNYPSFPSAQSTASFAAAQVLSILVPAHRGEWYEIAEEAGDMRRVAGAHFAFDVSSGSKLGELIGQQIIDTQELEKIL